MEILAGDDYSAVTVTLPLNFGPMSTSRVVVIGIVNDEEFEVTEDFTAELKINSTSLSGVSTSLVRTTICILDDDGMELTHFTCTYEIMLHILLSHK